jgi:hypothetical protein
MQWSDDVDCPFCLHDGDLLRALLVYHEPTKNPEYIHLSTNWAERISCLPCVLMGESLQMRFLPGSYLNYRVVLYFVEKPWRDSRNDRIPLEETVYGDAIVLLMSIESGVEHSLPENIPFHLFFPVIHQDD